jgi:hypothetical protein
MTRMTIVGTHGFSFRYTSIQPVGSYPYSNAIYMGMHEEFVASQNQIEFVFVFFNKHGCALKWHDNMCLVYKWNIPDKKS